MVLGGDVRPEPLRFGGHDPHRRVAKVRRGDLSRHLDATEGSTGDGPEDAAVHVIEE